MITFNVTTDDGTMERMSRPAPKAVVSALREVRALSGIGPPLGYATMLPGPGPGPGPTLPINLDVSHPIPTLAEIATPAPRPVRR